MNMKKILSILATGAIYSALIGTAFADEDAKFAASIQGGSLGVGVEGQYKLSQNFIIRGGVFGFSAGLGDETFGLISYKKDAELANALLGVDYHPLKNGWLISGGLIAGKQELEYNFALSEPLQLGDTVYTPQDVGRIRGLGSYETVSPYLAVGYDSTLMSREGWGLTVLAGIDFTGSPDVEVVALSGLLANTPGLNSDLAKVAGAIRDGENEYYPIFQIGLSRRF
jgi:hypothetical protein